MSNISRYIKDLQDMKDELLEEIDGGEECLGNDQKFSRWIETVDEAICNLSYLHKILTDLNTEANCE